MRKFGVLDYGIGNHASIISCIKSLGHRSILSNDRQTLEACDGLILPGVGSFPAAMETLHSEDLVEFIRTTIKGGRPTIGICLGMQLLMSSSSEVTQCSGLGVMEGRVIPLPSGSIHTGWNTVEIDKEHALSAHSGKTVFFNHSYIVDSKREIAFCTTPFQGPFSSGIQQGNIVGLQFHPEKSQTVGRELLNDLIGNLFDA